MTNQRAGLHPDVSSRVAAVVDGAIAAERIVGAVVIVSARGEVVHRHAAGFADREAGRAMRLDGIFRLASVSKAYIAAATMALVASGRLSLDASLDGLFADVSPRLGDGRKATITVRHLLTHTAGLGYGFLEPEDGPYHRAGVSDGMDRGGPSLQENVRRMFSVPLRYEPGTSWGYSLAFDVLGAVIERVCDRPLEDAVRALVTEPLGLADTGFAVVDPARLVTPYADGNPRPRRMIDDDALPTFEGLAPVAMSPARAHDKSAFASGGAGMLGAAGELVVFLEALRTASLLPRGAVGEMAKNQTGALPIVAWPGWSYGLGFAVLDDPGVAGTPQSRGTWQWGGAYGHSWFVDPAEELVVVALTNTAFEGMSGGGRFPSDLVRAVYAQPT